MPKTSTATIRLVMKKNRKNKNGEFPIYLVVCFNGRLEKATKVSCLEKNWDAKNELVKKSQPNSSVLNKILFDIKQKVIQRKNDFEYNNKVYTPSMLINDDDVVNFDGKRNDYKSLMEEYITEKRLKLRTTKKYKYAFNKLVQYLHRDDFIVDELNLGFVKDFVKWLDIDDGTKGGVLKCICAIWNYAISKGICDYGAYPFREFKTSKLKYKERDYFLEPSHMVRLMDYFLKMMVVRENGGWHYKEGAEERLHKRSSKEFAIMWFLLMYKLNGSAPTEIGNLRSESCQPIIIDKKRYWAIDFKRRKTQTDVHVRLERDIFTIIAVEHFLAFSKEFVYPIITDASVGDDKMQNQITNLAYGANKLVREAFGEINDEIIKNNMENDLDEPLVETEKVVMYTARHSFASHYVNSPNATIGGLASLLARSPNTIATYVHQLTHNKDIADMTKNMPI